MSKKETKKRIRDEIRAEQAEYDARTRRLEARIDYLRQKIQERDRAAS
jgi:hypothetical protein